MPSSSSALGKQAAGSKPCEAAPSLLKTIKRSKASFKRGKRSKENVEPPFEPIGKFLQKSKVELCSLEKRLRCFRHRIGESKCENKTKKWKIPIILSFQVFLRRHAGGWSALARTLQVWIILYIFKALTGVSNHAMHASHTTNKQVQKSNKQCNQRMPENMTI